MSTLGTTWQDAPELIAAQKRIRRTLLLAQVLGGIGIGAGVSMGSLMAFGVTGDESLSGISGTIGALSTALLAGPMVALAMRYGRRLSLTAGWAMAAIGCLVQVAALALTNLPLLILGLLVFGAGQAANLQSRFAAADIERPHLQARSLAVVVWATTIGIVLGPNLAGPGGALGRALGLPDLAGAYLIGTAGLAGAALVIGIGLRPDPLLTAQQHRPIEHSPAGPRVETAPDSRRTASSRTDSSAGRQSPAERRTGTLRTIMGLPAARLAFVAMVVNQTVMVTVMTLTPVHLQHGGHGLELIGLTISGHTLGMFAFSPLVGWLADRWGTGRTTTAGFGIILAALLCGMLGEDSVPAVMVGLFLLGLGWSFVMIAGSAMLNSAVPEQVRAPAQGMLDSATYLGAAVGAGSAGVILAVLGFAGLNAVSMLLLAPVAVLALAARGSRAH